MAGEGQEGLGEVPPMAETGLRSCADFMVPMLCAHLLIFLFLKMNFKT